MMKGVPGHMGAAGEFLFWHLRLARPLHGAGQPSSHSLHGGRARLHHGSWPERFPLSSYSALGSDTTPLPSWASLHSSTWGSLKQALKGLSVEFALLADKAAQQVSLMPGRLCCLFSVTIPEMRDPSGDRIWSQ